MIDLYNKMNTNDNSTDIIKYLDNLNKNEMNQLIKEQNTKITLNDIAAETSNNSSDSKGHIKTKIENIEESMISKIPTKRYSKSCKKKIIFGSITIVVLLIILIIILIKKLPKPPPEQKKIICGKDFDLFNEKCIVPAFYSVYDADYFDEIINLFNPNLKKNLLAMKINNTIMTPQSSIKFNNTSNNIVYYYMNENISISLSNMFENCDKLIDFSFNNKYINNYIITDLKGMFNGCISLTSISIYLSNGKNINDISYLFSNCIDLISVNITILNSNNIKYMNNLFNNCTSLININMKFLNYSNFSNSENLRILESENYYFSTINLVDMSNMFYNCISLITLDISKFNTKNVINMSNMFFNCKNLKNLLISNFNTQNAKYMDSMFYNCSSLTSLNVTNFNINNIYNMQKMFYGCNSLKYTNISNFIFTQNISLFYGLPDYCEIIINKKSLNKINTIPKTCKIFVEDDRSFIVYNSTSNGYSIICKDEYELYKGKCITYTFYAKYHIDYYYEKIKLFNKDKINDIFNMKIDNTNIEPINEYNNFNNIQDYIVYYYMEENIVFCIVVEYSKIFHDKVLEYFQDFKVIIIKN
jgi:surface protein